MLSGQLKFQISYFQKLQNPQVFIFKECEIRSIAKPRHWNKKKKNVQCTCTGDIHTKPDNVNIYNQLIKISLTSKRLMSEF
jgi:hypothetical protein